MLRKIFDIPVYALDYTKLRKHVVKKHSEWEQKYINYCGPQTDKNRLRTFVYHQCYPQGYWDYNHIIGFIKVTIEGSDICFYTYSPADEIQRYRWESKKKIFLKEGAYSCRHFYAEGKTNEQIREYILLFLKDIKAYFNKHKWYVDDEAFIAVNEVIDYRALLENLAL